MRYWSSRSEVSKMARATTIAVVDNENVELTFFAVDMIQEIDGVFHYAIAYVAIIPTQIEKKVAIP